MHNRTDGTNETMDSTQRTCKRTEYKDKKKLNMRQNMRGRGENKINPRLVKQEGNEIKLSRTRTGLYIYEYLIST